MAVRTSKLSPAAPAATTPPAHHELPVSRMNLMRVGYLVMVLGLAVVKWPLFLDGVHNLPVFEAVVATLLTAMSLLALLGLRYPVAMLPILLFESAWKLLWLATVATPLLVSGNMDSATSEILFSVGFVVVILLVTPWSYVWRRYVTAPGDPWR